MAVLKDALSPLAPPPPSAPPVVDATVDTEHDPRHLKFEQIKQMPVEQQYISLAALIEEFIAAGHNPRDPNDVMFEILGITPEFLELMLFTLKKKAGPVVHAAQPVPPSVKTDLDATPAPETQITS